MGFRHTEFGPITTLPSPQPRPLIVKCTNTKDIVLSLPNVSDETGEAMYKSILDKWKVCPSCRQRIKKGDVKKDAKPHKFYIQIMTTEY